jgi:hypothetical protein
MTGSSVWLPQGRLKSWGLTVLKPRRGGDAGSFAGGGWKVVWHTTEGGTMDSNVGLLARESVEPHIVFDPLTGRLTQMISLNRAGRALQHPTGPETNRANAIQVELLGFATTAEARRVGASLSRAVPQWGADEYRRIAALAVLLEHRHPIARHAVSFSRPVRMSGGEFVSFSGHCGHAHVPGNSHYDPGTGFNWPRLLESMKAIDH